MARSGCLVAVGCCCVLLAACGPPGGEGRDPRARTPAPAPRVVLTAEERRLWAPRPPDRSMVPVLLHGRIDRPELARHLALLDHAGYETIRLDDFVRFVRRRRVS